MKIEPNDLNRILHTQLKHLKDDISDQQKKLILLAERGFSLIEVLIAMAILSVMTLANTVLFSNLQKSNNYLEFNLKRTQLQNLIISQVLSDPNNCRCLFAGSAPFSSNPSAPGASLMFAAGASASSAIGRYHFLTPGVCANATIPQPFVNRSGIDGLKMTAINLKEIMLISGAFSGKLTIDLESTKEVLGPEKLSINIPVSISTMPDSPGLVSFQSCSNSPTGGVSFASVTKHDLKSSTLNLTSGKYLLNFYLNAHPSGPYADYSYTIEGRFNGVAISTLSIASPGDSDGVGSKQVTTSALRYLDATTPGVLSYFVAEDSISGGPMILDSLFVEVYKLQ